MRKRIGIMGGTFNPVHLGHLLLAQRAYEELRLDEVIFLPSKKPAHKSNRNLASEEERKQMIELAIADKPYFSVSALEYEREGNTYTLDTVRILKKRYPQDQFCFIIGADSLFQLETWHGSEELLKQIEFVVASRDFASTMQLQKCIDELQEKYAAKITIIDMPMMEISSTDIRNRASLGESISYLVPKEVEVYIQDQDIYG